MSLLRRSWLGLFGWLAFFAWGGACQPTTGPSDAAISDSPRSSPSRLKTLQGSFEIEYQASPSPIPLNELFSLQIKVFSSSKPTAPITLSKVTVDGFMPDHNHGMLRQPQSQIKDASSASVEGMLFHMPGTWELRVDVTADGKAERATFLVVLP